MPNTATAPAVVPTVGVRKLWRLKVLDDAPFTAYTLAGHTFHQHTEPDITDPKQPKGYRRGNVDGIIEPLLDEEVKAIRAAMDVTYVRWINRDQQIAQIFKPHEKVPMDPISDEPVGKFLRMEPASPL